MTNLVGTEERPREASFKWRSEWRIPRPPPGDGYLAGTYPSGITTVDGAPVTAVVRIHLRAPYGTLGDGILVAQTESAADGSWVVEGLDTSLKFDVIGRKDGYNDVIKANVSPVPLGSIAITGALTLSAGTNLITGSLSLHGGRLPYTMGLTGPNPPAPGVLSIELDQVVADDPGPYDGPYDFTITITSANGVEQSLVVHLESE